MKAKQRALWWVWCVPLIGFVSPPKQKLKQFRECAFDIWVLICANKRQRVIQQKNKRERQRVEGGCVGPLPSTTVLCLIMMPILWSPYSWNHGKLATDSAMTPPNPTQPNPLPLVPLYAFTYIKPRIYYNYHNFQILYLKNNKIIIDIFVKLFHVLHRFLTSNHIYKTQMFEFWLISYYCVT